MFVQSSFPFISQKHFPKLGMIIGKEPLQENPAVKISGNSGAVFRRKFTTQEVHSHIRQPGGLTGKLHEDTLWENVAGWKIPEMRVFCWKIIELNDGFSIA
jgi:hypothetical protein